MLINEFADKSAIPVAAVKKLSKTASHRYKAYTIQKRRGGHRLIHHPSRPLKMLQRWIVRKVLSPLPVHGCAMGYRKNLSIADNAQMHVKNSYLMRMDFKDFFHTIVIEDGRKFLGNQGLEGEDLQFVLSAIFRFGKLTIGAPSSPSFSNAACYQLDAILSHKSGGLGITYTRYADDLYFSAPEKGFLMPFEKVVQKTVADLSMPSSLEINHDKTSHMSKKGVRKVTGVVLTNQGKLSIGRIRKRQISAMIHQFSGLDEFEKEKIVGWLGFANSIEPDFVSKMRAKYSSDAIEEILQFRRVDTEFGLLDQI